MSRLVRRHWMAPPSSAQRFSRYAPVPDGSPSGCPAPSSLVPPSDGALAPSSLSPFDGAPSSAQRFSRSAPVPYGSPSGCPVPSSLVPPSDGALAPSSLSPFLGDSSAPKLKRLLDILHGSMSVREMMAALGFASRDKFLKNYLSPSLKAGLIEMTDPDSPKSPKQRYRRSKGDM